MTDGLPSANGEHVASIEVPERSFHDLIERAPYVIYVVDRHMRIVSMNERSRTGAFANVRPVIGRELGEALRVLWSDEVTQDIVRHFRGCLETGRPYRSRDFVNTRSDLDVVESYEWEVHRIRLPDDSLGVVCYSYDSTEMRETQKRLQEADRRKDEFLATLGHELRNPLAPIRNAASLLQHPSLATDKVVHFARIIERQARAMAVLLDDLLEISRISTGKLQLKKTRVTISHLVDAAIEPAKPLLESRRQSLQPELASGPAVLDVDPVRIAQVLTNLLTNAAKYSERGSAIVLRTSATAEEVAFEIQDTGIGIPADQLPSIFQMFAQVTPSIERSEGGLGIGLAVAKALVEMHGGRIEATSPGVGQGSTFKVVLPRGTEAATAAAGAESRIQRARATTQGPVVVADDNVDAAGSLAAMLELDGFQVHVAYDGVEALEIARRVRPVACFVDIGMPRMNGFELAQQLRQFQQSPAPLLVATTGWGQAEDKRRAIEAGFDVHMTKPIDPTAAAKVIADRTSGVR